MNVKVPGNMGFDHPHEDLWFYIILIIETVIAIGLITLAKSRKWLEINH